MSIEETFGNLFKPELKSSGRKLVSQEKISLSTKSDTMVQAYVRVAPPFKVTLTSEDISSSSFTAECTCPVARKNRFCKHIWATLLCTEETHPDFLNGKTDIENSSTIVDTSSAANRSYQETAKQKASDYRKEQYQKQKSRLKDQKRERKGKEAAASLSSYTPEVEASLVYFSANGFPMPAGPSREIMTEAKRKLSRFFHPDKGGTHEESVELNRNCEVLLEFLGKRS